MTYVLNKDGVPLMPTDRGGRVRRLLKTEQAKIVKREPFTIQLLYDTPDIVQEVEYSQDSGYLHIGSSACSDKAELYSAEIELNANIKNSLQERRKYRRTRRNRLRYRPCRFNNRSRSEGWLPPSIQHKVNSHIKEICKVASILPISKIFIEVATFDTQKLKNPDISGKEYQEGEMCDFRNLREYTFYRDDYTCQICGRNAFNDKVVLHMHHVEYWNNHNRANTPANTLTVCTQCHSPANHAEGGKLYGLKAKFKPLKAETQMTVIRRYIVNEAKRLFPSIEVVPTYGYLTKDKRITLGLEKTHANDAYCIGDKQPELRLADTVYYKQKSKNNRSLSIFYDAKYIDSRDGSKQPGKVLFNGRTCRNKNLNTENLHKYRERKVSKGKVTTRKKRYGIQPHDTVLYKNRKYEAIGTNSNGKCVAIFDGNKRKNVSVNKVSLIAHAKTTYRSMY